MKFIPPDKLKNTFTIIAAHAISSLTVVIVGMVLERIGSWLYFCKGMAKKEQHIHPGECDVLSWFSRPLFFEGGFYIFIGLFFAFLLSTFPIYLWLSSQAWKRNYRNLGHFLFLGATISICGASLYIYNTHPETESDMGKKATLYAVAIAYAVSTTLTSVIHWWMKTRMKDVVDTYIKKRTETL